MGPKPRVTKPPFSNKEGGNTTKGASGATEQPSVVPNPNKPSTSKECVKQDLKLLEKEVALEEKEFVDPLGTLATKISNDVPKFPSDILKILGLKIKEKFESMPSKTYFNMALGISISTSLFNLMKDIYVASVSVQPGAKTLSILGILSSLISLASNISIICLLNQVNFDLEASLGHINDTIKPYLEGVEPCTEIGVWEKFKAWIPRIITFIGTVIATGLSFLPKGSVISTIISNYGNSKKIGEDISSTVTSFLEDVVGITLEGDPEYVNSLVKLNAEGVELLTTPMHRFHIDKRLRAQLITYPKRIDEATLHRTNNDTFKTLRMTLQSLQATRNQVVQRVQELQSSSQRILRQEPVGIYLAGMGGVGKSYFAKEVAKRLSQECGYSEEIYCIDKAIEMFYEPYLAEDVGIANEAFSRRAENEPLLRDINKICSEDYFNFEGAALHNKNQPCHLKTVILTSNVKVPDLTKVQEPNVTAAMWSRFKRFEVSDPRFPTAEDARVNPNKFERGSHFLNFLEYTTDNSRNVKEVKTWTSEEVLQWIVDQCRQKELVYLTKMLQDNPYNFSEEGLKEVQAKLAILQGLVPCAKDGRVFTVRLEGPPGTGKTHFMEKRIIPSLLNTFPALTLYRWSASNPLPADGKFYLVVVDDSLDDSEKEYFDMIKSLSNRSIVVIGTNTNTVPRRDWVSGTLGRVPILGSPFDWAPAVAVKPIPGVPSGFWRRVGIADRISVGESVYEPFSSDVCHYRFRQGFIITKNFKQIALETAEEEIIEKYISYLQDAGDFIWSERRLNIIDPTVKIIARSYKDMVEVLSGKTGMFSLIDCFKKSGTDHPDPRMQIFLDSTFMKMVFNRAGVEEWRVPDRPINGPTRLHVAEKISAFLRKFKPDATVVVTITNPGLDDGGISTEPHLYELKGSMGYYTQASLIEPMEQMTYDQFGVRIHSTNETVSYEECVMIEKEHIPPNHFKPTTLRILKQTNLNHPQINHARMNYNRRINFAEEMASEKVVEFFKHPAVITLMAIMGVLAVSGIIYGIYAACKKACESNDEEELEPCDDSADSRDGRQRKVAAQALRKGSPPKNAKSQETRFTATNKMTPELEQEINDLWFVNLPGTQPYSEELSALSADAKKALSDALGQSNLAPATVTPDMEIKEHLDPRLTTLMSKVTNNLVTVTGNGTNYGLVFEGQTVLTTAHTVAGLDQVRIRSKEFTGVAQVVKVSIPRDLAVLMLLRTDEGRKPIQFPSLRKYFLANLVHLDKLAWFVKPFSKNTIFVCGKMISTPSYKCFSSHLSENFNPSEWIITFFQHHMTWSPTLFQKGECGLPLFVEINGEYKICGIFNAANQMRHVTFASVCASDFNSTPGISPMSESSCGTLEYRSEETGAPKFVANIFTIECLDTVSLGNVTHIEAGYPIPIGHCTKLRAHSFPKHKTRPLVPDNISAPDGLENTQRLSCINEHLCPDIDIPRRSRFVDGKRVPHSKEPLFLQIQKYSKAPEFTADSKIFTKAVGEVIHSYRIRLGVTKSKPLKLLSIKQAINGISGGALGPFSKETGTGPTLKAKFNISIKEDILHKVIDEPPIYVLSDNHAGRFVKNAVSEKLTALLNGVPILFLTKSCKKVEKIDFESWQKAKARLFTECDFEDNIVLKMLFGELQNGLATAPNTPTLLNLNPYTMASQVANLMGHDLTNMVGTDIESMDKHFPKQLIAAFVQIAGALYNWPKPVQRAIACSLMFPLQNFEGDIYISQSGNLSGWFVTSLINCVAQEIMIAYDRIKNLGNEPLPFDILSCKAEPYAILGDDKIQRLTTARAKAQEKSYLECGFRMQAGSKLQGHEERFCSRVIYKENGIYYGALKKSAISGLIYYASSSELEAIIPNFSLALFEAALHKDPKVYDQALAAILFVAKTNQMDLPQLASRERYREIYANYCTGISTVLEFCGHRPDILSILEHCKMGDNARMALNQYAQQTKQDPPSYSAKMEGPAHSPTWTVDLSFAGKSYVGTGESKSSAMEMAAKATLLELDVTPKMNDSDETITSKFETIITKTLTNFQLEVFKIENGLHLPYGTFTRNSKQAAKRAAKNPGFEMVLNKLVEEHFKYVTKFDGEVCVWYSTESPLNLKDCSENGFRFKVDEEGNKYVTGAVLQSLPYTRVIGVLESVGCFGRNDKIFFPGKSGPCNGPDTPIQPENVQQATMNTGAMTIPQMSNPQPSGQAPSLAPPAEKIVSALEAISTETLNPLGPPNMLAVGAVCFDIKDLAYTQFLDCNQQFVITDDTPPGSVLVQIPYDPLGEWINPYIKQYVSQHERYTGSLLFRITIVGNPTFSGLIGVAWQPRRVTTPTVDISEMQKYSYYGVTVELPSNKVIVLNDARQDLFWRSTNDTSDINNRPHLVVFTMLSLVSPLREGIQTRIRIASKLSHGGIDDGIGRNAFQVALPVIRTAQVATTGVLSQATRLADLVPEFAGVHTYMYTDGRAQGGRGTPLDMTKQIYGSTTDAFKLFSFDVFPDTGNDEHFQFSSATALPRKIEANNISITWVEQPNGVFQNTEQLQTMLIHTTYSATNLPPELFKQVKDRIFEQFDGAGVPSDFVRTFALRLFDPQTFDGLGLLGIFFSPEDEGEDFITPSGTYLLPIWSAAINPPRPPWQYAGVKISKTSDPDYIPVGASVKYVFQEGMMIVRIITVQVDADVGLRPGGPMAISTQLANPHACCPSSFWTPPILVPKETHFPNWDVEAVALPVTPTFLPAGWSKLNISTVPPSVVIPTIFNPTSLSDSTLEKALARRAAGIAPTQCLAFDIVDPTSNRRICSARYLQETGDIVCNLTNLEQSSIYAAYPANISEALLNNFGPIERSNAFALTDTTTWLSRKSTTLLSTFGLKVPKKLTIRPSEILNAAFGQHQTAETEPHALAALMLGGGALSGIGSGLSGIAQRRHEMNMQSNLFGHQTNLVNQMHGNNLERDQQTHGFNLERDTQSHNQELERMLEQFGFNTQLQQQQFQNTSALSRQSHQQTQSMAFASAPSRAFLGGATRGTSTA